MKVHHFNDKVFVTLQRSRSIQVNCFQGHLFLNALAALIIRKRELKSRWKLGKSGTGSNMKVLHMSEL